MDSPHKRRWFVVAGFLAGLAAVIWLAIRQPAPGDVVLSDGRRFTLKAVTFGTQHRYVHGGLLGRWMAPAIPARWRSRLGFRELSFQTAAPTLMVWGEWRFSLTNSPANYAAVADAAGVESAAVHYQSSFYSPKSHAIFGWNFSNYPRREKKIRFCLYPAGNARSVRLAKLEIANPALAVAAPWKVASLPITRREANIDFTLTEFTVGGPIPRSWPTPFPLVTPWNTATFQIAAAGRPAPHWRLITMNVSDASDNIFNCRLDSITTAPGEIRCRFPEVLWPSETGCRLVAEFVRTGKFDSNDVWTALAVPVPKPNSPVRITPDVERYGVKITSVNLDATSSGPVAPGAVRATAHLVLHTRPPVRGVRPLLAAAKDNQDRAVKFQEISLLQDGTLWFALEIPTGAAAVDLTFALTRTHFVEFVAQPARTR